MSVLWRRDAEVTMRSRLVDIAVSLALLHVLVITRL